MRCISGGSWPWIYFFNLIVAYVERLVAFLYCRLNFQMIRGCFLGSWPGTGHFESHLREQRSAATPSTPPSPSSSSLIPLTRRLEDIFKSVNSSTNPASSRILECSVVDDAEMFWVVIYGLNIVNKEFPSSDAAACRTEAML
jgi:hypothetical protein